MHLIELPLGSNRTVNAVLIDGDPPTLVDTGLKTPDSLAALEAGLERAGRRLRDIEQIVITHPHPDHFGAAAEIVRRSGARVVGDGVAELATFPRSFRNQSSLRLQLMRESGAPDDVAARWRARRERFARSVEAIAAERALVEGDTLRAGGADFAVLSTPGHAATSISLYQSEARLLIAGDMLIGNAGASVTLHDTSRPGRWFHEICESLGKLGALDVDLAFPGHGPLIEDGNNTIRQRRERALQRYEEVADLLRARPHTAWSLSTAIYPPGVGDSHLGLSQSFGYLEGLESEARATSASHDGTRTYRAD